MGHGSIISFDCQIVPVDECAPHDSNAKMLGILNINKPAGWTSRDAVNCVQKLVRPHKVGHAGTLDPLATGVLVVCIGRATRLIEFVQRMPKQYRATFLLGRSSPSHDIETEVAELSTPPIPLHEDIENATLRFVGMIEQVPPAYSAIKIAGKRAYTLARQGKRFTIQPRTVEIHEVTVLDYDYPQLSMQITCGSGTYIRSLGRDVAEMLGTSAVMSALTRTRIGHYALETSLSVDDLSLQQIEANIQPPLSAVNQLQKIVLTTKQIAQLRVGRPVSSDIDTEVAGLDAHGRLLAILRPMLPGLLKPHINFASSS